MTPYRLSRIWFDFAPFLEEDLAQASPVLMREPLTTFVNARLAAMPTRRAARRTGPAARNG